MKTLYYATVGGKVEQRKLRAFELEDIFDEDQRERLARGEAVTITQSIGVGTLSVTYAATRSAFS